MEESTECACRPQISSNCLNRDVKAFMNVYLVMFGAALVFSFIVQYKFCYKVKIQQSGVYNRILHGHFSFGTTLLISACLESSFLRSARTNISNPKQRLEYFILTHDDVLSSHTPFQQARRSSVVICCHT